MKTNQAIVNAEIRHQLAMALHDIRCLYKVYPFLTGEARKNRINERIALRYGATYMTFISQLYHDLKAPPTMTSDFPHPR